MGGPSPPCILFLMAYLFVREQATALQGLDHISGAQDTARLDVRLGHVDTEGIEGDKYTVIQHQGTGSVALEIG